MATSTGCQSVKVVDNPVSSVNSMALGVSFIVAFAVGAILAVVLVWLYFKICSKKKDSVADDLDIDAENGIMESKDDADKKNRRLLDTNDEVTSTDVMPLVSIPSGMKDWNRLGMFQILFISTTDKAFVELYKMDFQSTAYFACEQMEDRLTAILLLVKGMLMQLVAKDRISSSKQLELLLHSYKMLLDSVSNLSKEQTNQASDLKKKIKDSTMLEFELNKLQLKTISRMVTMVNGVKEGFRKELSTSLNLNDDETDILMQSLVDNVARLENKINTQRIKQIMYFDELMAQKMQKIETFGLSRERQKANTDSMSSALSAILQLMVQENKMADKHKLELLKGYNDSLRTVVTRFSSELQKRTENHLPKVEKNQEEKLKRLIENQRNQRKIFVQTSEKSRDIVDSYCNLLEQQLKQKNDLLNELDQQDIKALETIYQELERQMQDDLSVINQQLKEDAKAKSKNVVEGDLEKYWRMLEREMQQQQKMRTLEEKGSMRETQEWLQSRKSEMKELQSSMMKEFDDLKEKQDGLMNKVLSLQLDLPESAKKMILKEEDQTIVAVCDHLHMNKLCWQKLLKYRVEFIEQRLREMEIQMAQLKVESTDKKINKERQKLQPQLQKQIDAEKKTIEKLKQEAEVEMSEELIRQQEAAVLNHEMHMVRVIAHLFAAQMRKLAVTNAKQLANSCHHEDIIIKKMAEKADRVSSNSTFDALLQKHYKEVVNLFEGMQRAVARQEQTISEKLDSKQLLKERELQNQIERQQSTMQKKKNYSPLSAYHDQAMLAFNFKIRQNKMRRETALEMEKMRLELYRDLEAEMQQHTKDRRRALLADLAMCLKTSKDDIEQMVYDSVKDAGGDDKQANKLCKEILFEVQQNKSNQDTGRSTSKLLQSKVKSTDLTPVYPMGLKNSDSRSRLELQYDAMPSRLERSKSGDYLDYESSRKQLDADYDYYSAATPKLGRRSKTEVPEYNFKNSHQDAFRREKTDLYEGYGQTDDDVDDDDLSYVRQRIEAVPQQPRSAFRSAEI